MTPQDPCEYLVIHYVPFADQAAGFAWLVLCRNMGDAQKPLEALVPQGWKEKVRPEDRAYLAALMEDWTELRGQRAKQLFQQIKSLSTGPVRVERRGYSNASALYRDAKSLLAD